VSHRVISHHRADGIVAVLQRALSTASVPLSRALVLTQFSLMTLTTALYTFSAVRCLSSTSRCRKSNAQLVSLAFVVSAVWQLSATIGRRCTQTHAI